MIAAATGHRSLRGDHSVAALLQTDPPSRHKPHCSGCDQQYLDAIPGAVAILLILLAIQRLRARRNWHPRQPV